MASTVSVYINRLTFFSLGPDTRRQWKCRVGATAMPLHAGPLSLPASRQEGEKPGPAPMRTKCCFSPCNLSARRKVSMNDPHFMLCPSINHNLSALSLHSSLLLLLFLPFSKYKKSNKIILPNRDLKEVIGSNLIELSSQERRTGFPWHFRVAPKLHDDVGRLFSLLFSFFLWLQAPTK